VVGGRIKSITEGAAAPRGSIRLAGWTIPGLANVHSHAFQRVLRGRVESGGGDFWEWRDEMFRAAEWDEGRYLEHCRSVFTEMLESGITAVGEFHYLHALGNGLGVAVIRAAEKVGLRLTLLDACYLRGGLDGTPLRGAQRDFSDGDVERWRQRVDELSDDERVRIGAAIHSVRAVDPASMHVVAEWARRRKAPLHVHLAEQPAEVEECVEAEGCTPAQLLEREGVLGPSVTAVHAIHVDEKDVALLGGHHVTVGACPTTERELGDRVGPLHALAEAGCHLSVGSDSNAVIDMLEESRALELDQRRATGKRILHQPEALLQAATGGGMRALGWDAGELKPGMLADFITISHDLGAGAPIHAGYLVFARSGRDVTNVVVGGETRLAR